MSDTERAEVSSDGSLHDMEKSGMATEHVERIMTKERVPGHDNYYEKNGLRTYGDDEDHDHEPRMTFKRFMGFTSMAFLWIGSQIPVYLFGSIPPYVTGALGGPDRWVWFILAYLLSLAAVCPFVGSLSDLLGRRYVALLGACFLVIGMIICSAAQNMNTFIGGMTFTGIGAGINELTALAATSEMAPTSKRGTYVAILIFTIAPFCPSTLYAQLIAEHSSFRYVGLFCGVWNFLGLLMTAFFYFPPPRVNSSGLTRRQVLAQIDYVGGFLSVAGMILFMAGMQWGGYQYPWKSAHVLVPLLLGGVMLIAFCVWEAKFAKFPIFPKRLQQDPRILGLTLLITFISGANFFSILMFWPTQTFNMYDHDPVSVGLKGLPVGFSILAGACIVLVLLSMLKGYIRTLLLISSILMTAGCGAMSIARPDNMYQVWGVLIVAGLGIGGIVVPASIISTIVCPDDLIATVAALTLSIRVIGGSIGYCIYYNVFLNKLTPIATKLIGFPLVLEYHFTDVNQIHDIITMLGAGLVDQIAALPVVANNPGSLELIVDQGKIAFAESYKWVYYVSIAFGGISIVAACFLGDIKKYMDDHVAVVMH